MKYAFYVIIFLFFSLYKITYSGVIIFLLQAQTTPSPSSSTPDEEQEISQEIIESFGLQPYEYQYDPKKRDPFISLRQVKVTDISEINQVFLGPHLPLERFAVDQFKLIGVIWDTDEPRALIMDPNNKSHIVKKNDRIGPHKGYLAEIREGEVIIAEPKQQGLKIQYDIKTLTVQKDNSMKKNVPIQ